ncbi:MAG: hypothetical protein LBJ64_02840 [Deltaproteobacteria bacterium]|nr:hypothetical protein [Deltaproteobacteria bacterium]
MTEGEVEDGFVADGHKCFERWLPSKNSKKASLKKTVAPKPHEGRPFFCSSSFFGQAPFLDMASGNKKMKTAASDLQTPLAL